MLGSHGWRAKLTAGFIVIAALAPAAGIAAEPLQVYGPGGPLPAIQEAAALFGHANGIEVQVTAGPTGKWLGQAKQDADVVFSGAETMMSDLITAFSRPDRREDGHAALSTARGHPRPARQSG